MTDNPTEFTKNRLIFTAISSVLSLTAVFMFAAGTLRWIEGWLFVLWMIVMVLSNLFYLFYKDPALLAERSKAVGSDNQKSWDKILLSAAYILFMIWYILMPFDAFRFGWSPEFPIWLKVIGGILLIPSLYFIYQATAENTFMSTRVRIQSERKQHVISSGVYGLVRHPLYLGALFMLVGAPLLLGSLTGLVISLVAKITFNWQNTRRRENAYRRAGWVQRVH